MWNWLVIFVATKVATMKTKPYGVRFNEEDLVLLENEMGVTSPQRAVNFLFQYWREHRVGGSLVSLDLGQEQVIGKDIGYRNCKNCSCTIIAYGSVNCYCCQ